ncbi:MAG: hypothetical protein ACE5E4_11525 [Candidatus Binatia bacterium]
MADSIEFPSEVWFGRLAEIMKENEASYRDLGPADCTMVVKVTDAGGNRLLEVVFEAFGVKSVRTLDSIAQAPASHFVLEAPLPVWRDMIENIRANGSPDLEHTLNFLTFPDDPMVVSGPDQLEVDAFFRYQESLQRFFNGAAEVATRYSAAA